jgi:hypothetical protein
MVTRFISKGKGRKRKSIPITPKRKGVSVRSVSLEPKAIQKINKKTIKTLNTGEIANFSSSLNKLVNSARLKRTSFTGKKIKSVLGIPESVLSSYFEANRTRFGDVNPDFGKNLGFRQLKPKTQQAVAGLFIREFRTEDLDRGDPPRRIESSRLTFFNGRAYRVDDDGNILSVDEYAQDQKGDWLLISHTGLWQGSEERDQLLELVKGRNNYKSERDVIDALEGAGALQELHPPT